MFWVILTAFGFIVTGILALLKNVNAIYANARKQGKKAAAALPTAAVVLSGLALGIAGIIFLLLLFVIF